jgi:alpha-1,6-mannosyl-glycoprotein beta-1,2-N-acetylglucosaminyltransferase
MFLNKKYAKAIWHTSNHNTGLMLGRAQWTMLKKCLNAFCTYDDYNWDWTLQYISQTCFKLPLVSIYPSSSRVIHIGQW